MKNNRVIKVLKNCYTSRRDNFTITELYKIINNRHWYKLLYSATLIGVMIIVKGRGGHFLDELYDIES